MISSTQSKIIMSLGVLSSFWTVSHRGFLMTLLAFIMFSATLLYAYVADCMVYGGCKISSGNLSIDYCNEKDNCHVSSWMLTSSFVFVLVAIMIAYIL